MKRLYFLILVLGVLILANNQMAQAQNAPSDTKGTAEVSAPQNVGNKICPVSGERVDSMTPVTYEYEGKIYNFCCPMCIDQFKKDPQKYIEKVQEELRAEEKQDVETMPVSENPMEIPQGDQE